MMAFKTAEHRIAQSQVGAWKLKHKAPVSLLNLNGIEAFIGDNLPDMSIPQEEYEYKAGKRLWQRVICEDVISSIVIGSPVGILDSPDDLKLTCDLADIHIDRINKFKTRLANKEFERLGNRINLSTGTSATRVRNVMEFNDVNFAKKELGIEEWDSEA